MYNFYSAILIEKGVHYVISIRKLYKIMRYLQLLDRAENAKYLGISGDS